MVSVFPLFTEMANPRPKTSRPSSAIQASAVVISFPLFGSIDLLGSVAP
jgi:hypothetical protein